MNNTWIKSYRRILDHDLIRDPIASHIFFQVILHSVDYKTGKWKTGRIHISRLTNIPQSTVYHALQRLFKKYRVISILRTSKYSEITVLKWAKYQSTDEVVNKTRTTGEQQVNTIQEYRIYNNNNISKDILLPEKEKVTKKNKSSKAPNNHPYRAIIDYCRDKQGMNTNFVNYVKQTVAVKKILSSGYSMEDLRFVIDEMSSEEFWKSSPFDLMNVANNMHKYMNRVVMFKKGDQLGGKYAYN